MKIHQLANLFPPLEPQQLNALADNIKANGLLNPILLLNGEVIDGKNRLAACTIAGVKPVFKKLDIKTEGAAAIVSALNIHRRHLNESQRAMIAAQLSGYVVENLRGTNAPVKESAKAMNVSERLTKKGRAVILNGTRKLKTAVLKGAIRLARAEKISRLPKADQSAEMKRKPLPGSAKLNLLPKGGLAADAIRARESVEVDNPKVQYSAYFDESKAKRQPVAEQNLEAEDPQSLSDVLVSAIQESWPDEEMIPKSEVCALIRKTI